MDDLADKVALVTGGASGIGLAIAKALATAGAKVAIGDIDEAALERAEAALKEEGNCALPLVLDVANAESWRPARLKIEKELGRVRILCNNAGVGPGKSEVERLSLDDWNWTLGINLNSVLLGTQTFVPPMLDGGLDGHIVNTASILGLFATPFHAAYVTSKFAVVGLSEVMRMELAPKHIGVSVLCPALVRTSLSANSQKRRPPAPIQAVAGAPSPISMERPVGIEADAVAAATLSAIRGNRLYVLTHPEYRPVVEQRMGRILHAFEAGADRSYREDIDFLAAGSLAMDA